MLLPGLLIGPGQRPEMVRENFCSSGRQRKGLGYLGYIFFFLEMVGLILCSLFLQVAMNLRSRQLFTTAGEPTADKDLETADSPNDAEDRPDDAEQPADVSPAPSVDGLSEEQMSQLHVPKGKKKRARVAKRTLSDIKYLLDAYQCPDEALDMDVPTTAELQDALFNLYDAQTQVIASYEDLPEFLALLPDLHVSLVLLTVETPQYVDFKQFLAHLYRNHLGLVRTPDLLTGRDVVLKNLDGVFSLFSLSLYISPAFLIYFVLL